MRPSSIVDQDVDRLSVEFSCRRLDAGWICHIHSQYPQFVVAVFGETPQFGSRCWISTSHIELPSISEILAGKLEPNPSISTGD